MYRLLYLVWPCVMAVSMIVFWVLLNPLSQSSELAIQYHFLFIVFFIFLLELLFPYHKSWNKYDKQGWNDFIYNLTFPIAQLAAVIVSVKITGIDTKGIEGNLFNLDIPFWCQFVVITLIIDLSWYLTHRAFHTFPFLWRLHALHHDSEQLHVLNNARLHPLEVFSFFLPIMLIVQAIEVPAVLLSYYIVFQLTVGLLSHSNVVMKCGALSYIFNTPELHHWHHSVDRSEHDNNYGSVTVLWDHLFGSYFNPRERTASASIGTTTEVTSSWFGQMALPWVRFGTKETAKLRTSSTN